MNYRHAFHAGNFADVFKHLLLTRVLVYLLRKDTPVRYLDTHAGSGLYDLAAGAAERTQEWRAGIARLDGAGATASVQALIGPYLDLVGPRDADDRPALYPGSPVIAQRLLRPNDALTCNEAHPEEARALRLALGRDPRTHVTELDGYVALNAFVPPKERRGLVLIDPPYEAEDELARSVGALGTAYRKWPTGLYALWYPVKDPRVAGALAADLVNSGTARVLRLELLVEPRPRLGPHASLALIGCGLILVNPPFVLEAEARLILPYLAERLGRGGGTWRVEWLLRR